MRNTYFTDYYAESYRRGMEAIKRSEQLTPKEYGMLLQKKRRKKKRANR